MPQKTNGAKATKLAARWPPSGNRLRQLVEEAVVDAYDETEQRVGFFTTIDNNLALPFETDVLGVAVRVEQIELTEANEIVAICRRGLKRQAIPTLALKFASRRRRELSGSKHTAAGRAAHRGLTIDRLPKSSRFACRVFIESGIERFRAAEIGRLRSSPIAIV
jgi:hypothetical protein